MNSDKVLGFIVNNNGLFKIIKNNPDPQWIASLGHTDDMLERDFYKPAGKKLIMKIENNGRWFPCIALIKL